MKEFTIGPAEAGKKLHRYVRQLLPGVPLSGIYKMIRTGRIKRNGKRAKADDLLDPGDVIRLYIADTDFASVRKPERKFQGVPRRVDIVYEDADILVVNKPAGLLVHGADGAHRDTLVNRVLALLHDRGELERGVFYPSPVNRLDRNTSGLVLFGKTHAAARAMADSLKNHLVRKWYLAIVSGRLTAPGRIDARLQRLTDQNRTIVDTAGKDALTLYEPKVTGRDTTVVKIELVSGRTHQIRAHFAHLGHPLWNDVKYAAQSHDNADKHQWLHAAWLQLPDGRRFFAPLPAAFVDTLQRLGYSSEQIQAIETF